MVTKMRRKHSLRLKKQKSCGFTLVELIIVIVILGVISTIAGVFIKTAFDSYFSSVRRAEMVEMADVAVQRLAREVRLAVPNSLRMADTAGNIGQCASGTCYIELIPTENGGRYRNNGDNSTGGNFLCDGITAGSTNLVFDILGVKPTFTPGDFIFIDNDSNLSAAQNAYGGGSRATTAPGAGPNSIAVQPSPPPFANAAIICSYSNNRFQLVSATTQAVTYSCPISSSGVINRYSGYGFNTTQVTTALTNPVPVAGNAVYAVSCKVAYNQNVQQRNGLLYVDITISANGESVTVFRQIHVDNSP